MTATNHKGKCWHVLCLRHEKPSEKTHVFSNCCSRNLMAAQRLKHNCVDSRWLQCVSSGCLERHLSTEINNTSVCCKSNCPQLNNQINIVSHIAYLCSILVYYWAKGKTNRFSDYCKGWIFKTSYTAFKSTDRSGLGNSLLVLMMTSQ